MDGPHPRRWTLWLFRGTVTLEAVLAITQAALAGGFLSGHYAMLDMHALGASATGVTAVVQTLAAVLLWRPGGGPGWPALASGALFAAEAAQIVLGYARVLVVHVPLGVTIIGCAVLLPVWAWRTAPASRPPAPARTRRPRVEQPS
ncbi:hypothetical protein ACRYCC_24815 [Actinomadura scrupuli]|uniref:hypothetical protein n=1 Tax=Actinomadura scrupuli TaxID=559629 RepID=UPI003D99D09D